MGERTIAAVLYGRATELVIRDDMPIPDVPQRRRSGISGVLRRLEVGQSVEIPTPPYADIGSRHQDVRKNQIRTMAYQLGRRVGLEFYVRRTGPGTVTVWRCGP